MSKEKRRYNNFLPNNRIRLAPATRTNVIPIENFNENLFWRSNNAKQANDMHFKTAKKYNNDCPRKQTENPNFRKSSYKLINLQNLQHQQCHTNHSQKTHRFEKYIKQESVNEIFATTSFAVKCNKKHKYPTHISVSPAKLNKNHHCHRKEVTNKSKLLQLLDALPSILSHCHQHDNNGQFIWLKQVPQHKEVLCGMFEVLPPLLNFELATLTSCEIINASMVPKHEHPHICLLQFIKQKCLSEEAKNRKKSTSIQTSTQNHSSFNYGRVLKYLKKKAKPSDRDVIFGNACHLLSKRYGWDSSRIGWLLKLEQEKVQKEN